eukprot:CAMPEP_0181182008 /NCGR_PEP_ID=MMETSP1096-20121128/7650_1 /TAXON_ID=156174 ORGANISM="Chrysochromulina ericina, Strain CCMP281" /NCGR_SAMPLE_ID=MMETSP1096 /ASSEMBLY_ACC=CAM_ASM_000453 /LENGTH=126 /DNA_ID=CAMNT_0023270567 /DNA_START=225 /DNA_END=602 /DNA_ORIENTATION=+
MPPRAGGVGFMRGVDPPVKRRGPAAEQVPGWHWPHSRTPLPVALSEAHTHGPCSLVYMSAEPEAGLAWALLYCTAKALAANVPTANTPVQHVAGRFVRDQDVSNRQGARTAQPAAVEVWHKREGDT